MKYDKFFELAKAAGIEEAELYVETSYALSFSLFHGEVDNYSLENGSYYVARGIINGRFGAASCDVYNAQRAKYLVDEIVANAKIIENDDPAIIFKGSEKYKKVSTFNKELASVSIDEKMKALHALEKRIRELDPRIIEVPGVEYSESSNSTTLMNSHGLKLTHKTNYFYYVGQALAKKDEQVKSGYDLYLGNDFSKFDVEDLAKKVVENTVGQLGGEACESGKYKAVLDRDVVSALMRVFVGHADAEEVQKHSSLFIGKLGQKIASKKITIEDRPLDKSLFARGFDDEGVATYNKAIVKNGVLQTYLYNLTTASKEGVQSTGNGFKAGSKIGTSTTYLCLKPGKKSLEELFQEVGNGVYITSVSGLHAGLNPQSGNFSLQAEGFLIKDGKKDHPLDIITISGNLMQVFNDVLEVGNDIKVTTSATQAESVLVKSIGVGGK
ncbi:MAG: TldD/PmbA family protein [Bacilli bacterium]|nr:TldD/PmbA family protein [Bacilli bacterium]